MSLRVVGFDGTPVRGGAGARMAIFDTGADTLHSRRRRLTRDEFNDLADKGFITRVDLCAEADACVVVYQSVPTPHRHDRQGRAEWSRVGWYEAAAMRPDRAERALAGFAALRHSLAMEAWHDGRWDDVRRLAREGLMAVPVVSRQPLASDLYGTLYALCLHADSAESMVLWQQEVAMVLSTRYLARARSYGEILFDRMCTP